MTQIIFHVMWNYICRSKKIHQVYIITLFINTLKICLMILISANFDTPLRLSLLHSSILYEMMIVAFKCARRRMKWTTRNNFRIRHFYYQDPIYLKVMFIPSITTFQTQKGIITYLWLLTEILEYH